VSALLVRASLVMIDGNPLFPDLTMQWRLAAQTGATTMGGSPGFLLACRQEGVQPAREFDLSRLRQLGAAGSPLPPEGYLWVHEQLGDDVLLNVGSGGTDVCSALVQGSPLHPVWVGEISGRGLGVDARRTTRTVGRSWERSASWSSPRRCPRCPSRSGQIRTTPGTGLPTSRSSLACGATATGSASPSGAAASSPAGRTPPSTEAVCGWAPRSSTESSRSWTRSATVSWCTWRTRPAGPASSCCTS
jgi:hypothetical protein